MFHFIPDNSCLRITEKEIDRQKETKREKYRQKKQKKERKIMRGK